MHYVIVRNRKSTTESFVNQRFQRPRNETVSFFTIDSIIMSPASPMITTAADTTAITQIVSPMITIVTTAATTAPIVQNTGAITSAPALINNPTAVVVAAVPNVVSNCSASPIANGSKRHMMFRTSSS